MTTLHVKKSTSRSPLRRSFPVVLFALALGVFALLPTILAVDPPPDGGYPNGNTQGLLWEGAESEHPEKAAEYRRKIQADGHGQIPRSALMRAIEHAKSMRFNPSAWSNACNPRASRNTTLSPNTGVNGIAPEGANVPGAGGGPGPWVAGLDSSTWTWRGPGNVGGRINCIAITAPVNALAISPEYSSSVGYKTLDLGLVTFTTAGDKAFKFTLSGQNASSAGSSLDFDDILFIP